MYPLALPIHHQVVPEMVPSLLAIVPPAYVELNKITLKERLTHEQRSPPVAVLSCLVHVEMLILLPLSNRSRALE